MHSPIGGISVSAMHRSICSLRTKLSARAPVSGPLGHQASHDLGTIGGGDGTVQKVVAGIVMQQSICLKKMVFALIPSGTGNDWAKSKNISSKLNECVETLKGGKIKTQDVGVVIDAEHFCVKCRGVEDTGSSTVTSRISGDFMDDPQVRMEFLSLANHKH